MKILVATPAFGHQVHNEMVQSLLRVVDDLKKNNYSVNWHSPSSPLIAFNRNLSCEIAIKEQYDYLLFWDADESIDDSTFVRGMLETAYKFDANVVGLPVALKGDKIVYNCSINGVDHITEKPTKPIEIQYIGTGMMLIKVSALVELEKPFFTIKDTYNGEPGFWPEDWNFCDKIKKIVLDPRFVVHHYGLKSFE